MVNNSDSVTPPGHGPHKPDKPEEAAKPKNTGEFQFTKGHKFLGMQFTAKEWNKLMNTMMKNMTNYMNKVFQKMKEKLKKDWQRGAGEDVD